MATKGVLIGFNFFQSQVIKKSFGFLRVSTTPGAVTSITSYYMPKSFISEDGGFKGHICSIKELVYMIDDTFNLEDPF